MKRDPDNILLQIPCLIHLPIQFAARWEEAAIGGAEHLQHVEQADDAHQLALPPPVRPPPTWRCAIACTITATSELPLRHTIASAAAHHHARFPSSTTMLGSFSHQEVAPAETVADGVERGQSPAESAAPVPARLPPHRAARAAPVPGCLPPRRAAHTASAPAACRRAEQPAPPRPPPACRRAEPPEVRQPQPTAGPVGHWGPPAGRPQHDNAGRCEWVTKETERMGGEELCVLDKR
ncbi:hypothetical protein PVAP13_7NG186655 [Panicum virgatum]|uniref:Uncharacterized protein n=1 Tax=Panicum virgatum TaxID=38727 RepID=A0A8T0Q1L7_PANVG|nr:hypothetical protein PVAP13_7NG186655 [Panicum virgatum]